MSCPYEIVCPGKGKSHTGCVLMSVPDQMDCTEYTKTANCKGMGRCKYEDPICEYSGFTCEGVRSRLPKHLLERLK